MPRIQRGGKAGDYDQAVIPYAALRVMGLIIHHFFKLGTATNLIVQTSVLLNAHIMSAMCSLLSQYLIPRQYQLPTHVVCLQAMGRLASSFKQQTFNLV